MRIAKLEVLQRQIYALNRVAKSTYLDAVNQVETHLLHQGCLTHVLAAKKHEMLFVIETRFYLADCLIIK